MVKFKNDMPQMPAWKWGLLLATVPAMAALVMWAYYLYA